MPSRATAKVEISLVKTIGAGIFLFSFFLANFTLFRRTTQDNSRVRLRPDSFKVTSVQWAEELSSDGSFRVADEVLVSFRVFLECTNPMQLPTTVKLSVHSVESEWHVSADLTGIEFGQHGRQEGFDGRLRLNAFESSQLQIGFAIPFDGPSDKLDFGYMGSLSKMVVVLAAEQPDSIKWYLPINFSAVDIQQKIRSSLVEASVNRLVLLHRDQNHLIRQIVQDQISTVLDIGEKL